MRKPQVEIDVNPYRKPPVRFWNFEWHYATGRQGSYDDGELIGLAYEYEAAPGRTIWIADDFVRVLHEPCVSEAKINDPGRAP